MEKKVLQDIVAPETREPKDGPTRKWDYGNNGQFGVLRNNKSAEPAREEQDQDTVEEDEVDEPAKEAYTASYQYNNKDFGGNKKKFRFPGVAWIVGAIGVILVVFIVGWTFFSTATVKVVLTQQTTTVDGTFAAVRAGDTSGNITYQTIKLQETATQDVKPTGEKDVQQKATGQIIVSGLDEKNLKLIANTRFQSPDGKIYRIDKAVTVPAAKKDASGKLTPGTVQATVFADQPGDSYNIGTVDFTIPGLVGTDLEGKYTARGITDMTGGYSGVLKYASEEDIKAASAAMQERVREKLLTSVSAAIGEDSVLYNDAVFINFKTNIPTTVSENGLLKVEEVGLLQAFVFDRKEFSSMIAKRSLSSYDDSSVMVQNLDGLSFAFEEKDVFDINVTDRFNFTLKGEPHIVWVIDDVSLKNDLAGLRQSDISTIVSAHSSIRRIETAIKPFWRNSFPDNPDAITIEEVLE